MAAYIELYMDQGATFNNSVTLVNDSTNTAINVASYTIRSQMRRSHWSANATANLVCTVADAANGIITVGLAAANTSNIRSGRYVFDLEIQDSSNTVTRLLEGIITVTPEVSR